MASRRRFLQRSGLAILGLLSRPGTSQEAPVLIRSAQDGPWSSAGTWEGGAVPAAGVSVLIRAGHRVLYDISSSQPIRAIYIAGALAFAPDRDTRLDVGLIKIQTSEDTTEDGFNCLAHLPDAGAGALRGTLEVGTQDRPIAAGHTALIRLVYFDGMEAESFPAIVCCGGSMNLHGAPLSRTWVKLGATARAGDTQITLAEPVTGWRVGDRIILTATARIKLGERVSARTTTETEERTVMALGDGTLLLDRPLAYDHLGAADYGGEVANLSRNVTIESADPSRQRGHTMYHVNSTGSVSYTEFRHLGKEGVLGRYSLHFHLVAETMRGASVIGASFWDSGNRWLTIHGTNYLVVRDCVGYQSIGHGFFLEDGTEVYNVLDRNLGVQAFLGKPLPNQVLPFDRNDGACFWWANSRNTFTRNVAVEGDQYGFRFDAVSSPSFDTRLDVQQPDGSRKNVDIRTLPFVRFEDNEAHCHQDFAFSLGGFTIGNGGALTGGVGGVGPDARHPFILRNTKVWDSHWAFHPVSPSVMVDGYAIHQCEYGLWHPVYVQHAYRGLVMDQIAQQRVFSPTGAAPVESDFPNPLDPVDDAPPATVITYAGRSEDGRLVVRGTTSANGVTSRVLVSGQEAQPTEGSFAQWQVTLDDPGPGATVSAYAEDTAGNIEPSPHVVFV